MKKSLLFFLLVLSLPSWQALAKHGHIQICNKTSVSLNISYFRDKKSKKNQPTDVLKRNKCFNVPYFNNKGRLKNIAVNIDPSHENPNASGSLYLTLNTRNDGVSSLAKITQNTPYDTAGKLAFNIKGKNKVFNRFEVLHLNITKTIGGCGFNDFSKSCQSYSYDRNQKDGTLTAKQCHIFYDPGYTWVQSPPSYPDYTAQITGFKYLLQGIRKNVIPYPLPINNYAHDNAPKNYYDYAKTHERYFKVYFAIYPSGYGINLPKGSYLKTCKMAYYDQKEKQIYAACPVKHAYAFRGIHLYKWREMQVDDWEHIGWLTQSKKST